MNWRACSRPSSSAEGLAAPLCPKTPRRRERGRLTDAVGGPRAVVMVFVALLVVGTSAPLAGENVASTSPQPFLEIAYNGATDLVSIDARHAPLRLVLQELARKAHLVVEWQAPQLVSEQVSLELQDVHPEQALRYLLREFNFAFLYSPVSVMSDPPGARLVKVVVLSRKGKAGGVGVPAPEQPRAEEIRAAEEGERAIDVLVARLQGLERFEGGQFPDYRRAVDVLKGSAPERLVDPLVELLLQSADPTLRVYAASTLGEIADFKAVDSLAWTFRNDTYPLARQTAMHSLLRIGGESALEPVFDAFRHGDLALQRAIAIVVANQGNETTRRRLEQMMAEGRVPEEVVSVWQFASREAKQN